LIEAVVVCALFGSVITCYVTLNKRVQNSEDCVEEKLTGMQNYLHEFQKDVIDRLARIETKVERNNK